MAAPAQVAVSITTSSQSIQNWQQLPPPQPPEITLNDVALPPPSDSPPYQPVGAQVVVFDSSQDLTDPASIISNQYQIVANMQGNWYESYRWMWDDVATQVMSSGDTEQQVVILATFGLDVEMTATAATFGLCLDRGAGGQLQQWGLLPSVSEGGYYIEFPANYVLIGNSGYGYGEGYEIFEYNTQDSSPLTTTLQATIDNPGAPPT
jgi:hypothetical protein